MEKKAGGGKKEYLLLIQNPWRSGRIPKAHGAENWDRDAQTTVSKLDVFGFTSLERGFQALWNCFRSHLAYRALIKAMMRRWIIRMFN